MDKEGEEIDLNRQALEGIWTCAALEMGGIKYNEQQIANMAKFAFVFDDTQSGWSGLWSVIKYGYEEGNWSQNKVMAYIRFIILGAELTEPIQETDFYLFAGGRFRITPDKSPKEINMEQYWRGSSLPGTYQKGIYQIENGRLSFCLGSSGNPRPVSFSTEGFPQQSLEELIRENIAA